MKIIGWLRLIRLQTAALTMAITALGYVLAGGELFSLAAIEFCLFALVFHAVGHLDNNICDLEYDRADPSKQHFPLVTGEISLKQAKLVRALGFVLGSLWGLWLSNLSLMSISFIALSIGMGLVSNRYSKKVLWKPIPFALCFISLPSIAYYSLESSTSRVFLFYWIYGFLALAFELGVGGDMKEVESSVEVNILRSLGCHIEGGYYHAPLRSNLIPWLLKLLNMGFGLGLLPFSTWNIFFYLAFWAGVLFFTYRLLSPGVWDRAERVKGLAAVEIFTYLAVVFALGSLIGPLGILVMTSLPFMWLVLFNRLIWKTTLRPAV